MAKNCGVMISDKERTGARGGTSRRNAMFLMSAGLAGSLVNGLWIEPRSLSVTREDVRCRNLPAGLAGLRIALLADFHYRPDADDVLLEKVVSAVSREKPDLIVLAGDFINADPGVLAPLLGSLRGMSATHGVFGVMGNHDGWSGNRSSIRRQFEKAGISFLINQHSMLSIRGEKLAVAGTDFVWLGNPDPARALRGIGVETPVLAMVHEPDYFDVMRERRDILLQLSGHTHGGQCRVPLVGFAPIIPKYGRKYVHGGFSRGGSNLFVTRGVGTTGPRARFACPPELAILTLRGSELS